jgi:hypothetical protein
MAYFFLLRQSEYIYQAQANSHAILSSDVEFRLTNDAFVKSHDIANVPYDSVNLVKVTLRHCKNDPFRQGNSFWCAKSTVVGQETKSFDLVREMFVFAAQANSKPEDVFTSIRPAFPLGKQPILRVTYKRMMQLLSKVATDHNLSPNVFGTHSFRIAGATTLDAGHIETNVIQKMGGWKSTPVSLEYAQASTQAFAHAHAVLSDPTVFTLRDLHLQIQTRKNHAAIATAAAHSTITSKVDSGTHLTGSSITLPTTQHRQARTSAAV